MPVSIHRNFSQYSPPSNWHHPSGLPPYQSQPSMDLSSWMPKYSMSTSNLNSERIPSPQNTLTISQTPVGPSTPMVYYVTLDTTMFRTPATSDSMFSSTPTIIPSQDISVRGRHPTKSK